MLIHQYETLFRDTPEWLSRARAVSGRCREFSSLVAERLILHPLDATLATTVTYHASCHLLRGLGVDSAPKAIIGRIAAARVVRLEGEDECCGFGGLFAVKHDAISARMLDRKLDAIARSGASRVVTCDAGCLLHIEGGLHRRGSSVQVQHLGEVLDEAAR
jgi:L-lactate dehydrogenase complex protein LldE